MKTYTLGWYEKINGNLVKQCRPVHEYEYEQIMRTKKILGFKKGSVVYHVQIEENVEIKPEQKFNPKENKPYYRKERW